MQSCKWKAESWLLNPPNARTEFRRSGLEFSNLSKPMQRALDFRAVHGVTAGEMFQADLLKPGAFQRIKYSFLRAGPRNLVCRAAAEPNGYAEEIRRRLIVVIGGA